jgi:hypothetical protein
MILAKARKDAAAARVPAPLMLAFGSTACLFCSTK